jgi:SEL1 protein
MGLLYLHGIPQEQDEEHLSGGAKKGAKSKSSMILERDLSMAEKYFTLAKEMGNADATYNLAMLWLGWKTHYITTENLKEGGTTLTTMSDLHLDVKEPTFALHLSKQLDKHVFKGPATKDTNEAFKLLQLAAQKGHLQAKHRLGSLYSQGIHLQGGTTNVPYQGLTPDCLKAKAQFHWIVENAWPKRAQRLRKGYEDYISGNVEASLRNYLFAAETGSLVGQANAAWLLERGVCLQLSDHDCAKASVRLWKAAAAMGHAEACLRVGDFYYYGWLRDSSTVSANNKHGPVGPFGWVQYFLYPEVHLVTLKSKLWQHFQEWKQPDGTASATASIKQLQVELQDEKDCEDDPSSCLSQAQKHQQLVDSDLSMAAHYYHIAVDKHHSARANFNLGFLHEWGLGLKQDFPLAKRHYDLAGSMQEAELAVQIALWSMSIHEQLVKWQVQWKDYYWSSSTNSNKEALQEKETEEANDDKGPSSAPPRNGVPGYASDQKTKTEVILEHLFSWSSLLIVLLTYILTKLMEFRQTQQRI